MYTGWKVLAAVLNFGATVILINKLGWTGLGLALLINLADAIRNVTEDYEKQRIEDLNRLSRLTKTTYSPN